MPRPNREWIAGGLYHVMSRGSNRLPVVVNEGDFVEFEQILLRALDVCEVEAYAWAVLPNHWHGAFRCPPGGLSHFMQRVNHTYALRFDRRWGRVGHVWQQRFKAVLQETETQYRWLLRYVVRNPVEAGLCASVEDWRWTSYGATVGLRPAPSALRVDEVLANFSGDPILAVERYREFVETP